MKMRKTYLYVPRGTLYDFVFLSRGIYKQSVLRTCLWMCSSLSYFASAFFSRRFELIEDNRVVPSRLLGLSLVLTYIANIPYCRLFHYSYGDISYLTFARDPGILITLPWRGHIHQVSNKIHRALRYLKFNKDLLSKQVHDTLISLARAHSLLCCHLPPRPLFSVPLLCQDE